MHTTAAIISLDGRIKDAYGHFTLGLQGEFQAILSPNGHGQRRGHLVCKASSLEAIG